MHILVRIYNPFMKYDKFNKVSKLSRSIQKLKILYKINLHKFYQIGTFFPHQGFKSFYYINKVFINKIVFFYIIMNSLYLI